jgi:acyl-CoA dehydrogenase
MNFEFSEQQLAIQDAVSRICRNFGEDYWLERDTDGNFPEEFVRAITEGGWLGIAMPEEFGGAGLGVSEALILAHTIARSGAGMSGASAVHLNLFGPNPIVVFGTHEQKSRFLPPLIQGLDRACFGVTEPNSGLNTSKLETRAERDREDYAII